MYLKKSYAIVMGVLATALGITGCASVDDGGAPIPGLTSSQAAADVAEVKVDPDQLVAAMKVCQAALTLEHQLLVDFDWNLVWETAANMEIDAKPLADVALHSAAEAIAAQVPEMLEDDELFANDAVAFMDAITPLLNDVVWSCEDWSAVNLYGYEL